MPIFEALGQIRANRVFSPIRVEIRAIRVQSCFLEGRCANGGFFEARIDSQKNYLRFVSVAIPAEPRGEKIFFSAIFGW